MDGDILNSPTVLMFVSDSVSTAKVLRYTENDRKIIRGFGRRLSWPFPGYTIQEFAWRE
jgi:hypothetical protein